MIYFLVAVLTFLSAFISAEVTGKQKSHRQCTRELEQIVYQPETPAYHYLKRISKSLKVQSPLLFTAQNQSILANFAATYNVQVFVTDALGFTLAYPVAEVGFQPSTPLTTAFEADSVVPVAMAQLQLKGEGFQYINLDGEFIGALYSFAIWSDDGEYYGVWIFDANNNIL